MIAIVDDDPVMRQVVQGLLASFGYQTETYESGEEFIALAPESKACCLLTDIQLGGITGIEMVQQLAEGGIRFPTIFMTGSDDAHFLREALKLSCVAFLRKPFLAGPLIEAIAKAVMIFEQRGAPYPRPH